MRYVFSSIEQCVSFYCHKIRDRVLQQMKPSTTPWHKGYATELTRTALALVRGHLPPWPVIARTRVENMASIRTAERTGLLRRSDLDTEHVVFALGWASLDDH